ncbi:MAG TPA: aminotransferase class III-fold pyridoxal phosphate-dependent enzyme [Alphaproteobacteria bacterium]|nr:aminotransferase class III-fold pyridoxal phosphate-dependent enzyme [Alphaproteobacteria bacterium]
MAADLRARDEAVIGSIGKLRFSPLAASRGKGSYLFDWDGRKILDLSASAGAASLGYGHPAIVGAVARAVRDMAGASLLLYPNENAAALAEELLALVPGEGERRVWFGHSGSDANDTAVRAIARATGRNRFISFIGSYHGGLSGSIAVSGHTAMTHTLSRPGLVLLPYPDPYRGTFSADEVLKLLDYQFATTSPPAQVAAVMIEPLMSDGGLIVPPKGFLKALAERCRRHGILVVVDEVKVGLARTGRLNAFEHEGLEPDVVVFGKGLGGGLPLSALVGPKAVLDCAPAFALQTTAGNPVATAAARAVLATIRAEGLTERVAAKGAKLMEGLRALGNKHETIGEVRGRGFAVGIDLVEDRASKEPVPVVTTAKVIYRAYELGCAFIYVGLAGNVLELTPSLLLSDAEAEEGIGLIDRALADVAQGKVSDEAVKPFMMW